ncbi:MAG: YezD family protein [Candidatus Aureabacteria bacterium]|nr:YezD family protein [Candidatus Auribacterota bacterium]
MVNNMIIEDKKRIEEVYKFIKEIRYGEVVVTLHDSEIVQVEKREKKRFNIQKRL